jgi:2-methylcitrate dehydratase PrpD
MQEPAVLRERAKVQVIAEERLEQLLPQRVAVIEVLLNDGTRLNEQNDTVRGTPENPMTRDEIVEKARDLVTPVLGAPTCAKLIESVLALEQIENVRELRPLLQRA